jgi:hypothetical protein
MTFRLTAKERRDNIEESGGATCAKTESDPEETITFGVLVDPLNILGE